MKMIISIVLHFLYLVVLISCSGFFNSSETAFCALSNIKLRQMIAERKPGIKRVTRLKANMDFLITTVLTGNNFVHTLLSAISTAFIIEIAGQEYVAVSTLVVTVLVIIFGEILPKTVAALYPEKVALKNSMTLIVVQKVFFPVVWIFLQFTKFVGCVEKVLTKKTHPVVTEPELKTLIDVGQKEGTLEQSERTMLYKIFEFTDLTVHDVMRHRSMIKSVNAECTYSQVSKIFEETGFSRLPVYDGDPENLVGMLHYKSVIFNREKRAEEAGFVRRCMSKIMFVPETISAVELLQKFKDEHKNIAVAVDEHGTNCGVVTMDDLLRCVFGHVIDDSSNVDEHPESRIQVVSNTEFIVPGELKLGIVNSALNLEMKSDNFDTLGGWILEKFDYLPSTGDVMVDKHNIYIVEDQSARRIKSVRIRLANPVPL